MKNTIDLALEKNTEKKRTVFVIDGGAGRAVMAIPALIKYHKNNPNDDFKICVHGWDNLFWSIPELQDKTFNIENKGIFDNVFLEATRVISPEPYRLPAYYRQEKHMIEAFDFLINETNDHTDLGNIKLGMCKSEEVTALNAIGQSIIENENRKNRINVMIQPWGSTARKVGKYTIDDSSRSLTDNNYVDLVSRLDKTNKYNLFYFGDRNLLPETDIYTLKYEGDLRFWLSLTNSIDYFIGVDSVGQHFAKACEKPGTVILGSTFAENISYPKHFQIFEKEGTKKYAPLRISALECHLTDRYNDVRMELTDKEIDKLVKMIEKDISEKVKK
jgi:hypothetical protein